MGSTEDWAAQCAQQILDSIRYAAEGDLPCDVYIDNSVEDLAVIIATHAAPLVALLLEARREHNNNPCNTRYEISGKQLPCSCGADEWNARIDKALKRSARWRWSGHWPSLGWLRWPT